MSENLTIIKGSLALVNYPFTTLPPDVLSLMHRCYAPIALDGMGQMTKLFDAYCSITQTKITYLGLSMPGFEQTVRGYLGALSDPSFVDLSRGMRNHYAREFVRLLDEMAKEIPLLPTFKGKDGWPKPNARHWTAAKQHLDPEAVRFWNGWPVETASDKTIYISLARVWLSHGAEFAEDVYKCLSQHTIKMKRPRCSELSAFLNFIADHSERWPVNIFRDPIQIKQAFLDFMVWYFTDQHNQGNDLATATKSYAAFIKLVDSTMIASGLWVKPFSGSLPKPKVVSVPGANTNKKKNKKGEVIKHKLITEVPYEVTDSQAIDLLFKVIKADNDILYRWASSKAWKTSNAQKARDRLAKAGSPKSIIYATHATLEDVEPEDVCAAFNMHGFAYVNKDFSKRFGKNITREWLNTFLKLPTPDDLYPFKLLMVNAYPCITQSFLDNFELYNEKGDLTGFLKLDGYYQLTGYKDRKGGALSEIKINLKPRDAVRVRQIIRSTQPLRDFLKSEGNDAWRYLFISCARGLTYPTKMMPTNWSEGTLATRYQHLTEEFGAYLKLPIEEIEEYICRISITSLRATRAVLLYIENNSLSETAKALGHNNVLPELLSSYLPEPILAFFQTRWIRAFQRGIICRAMKDSKYLLQVSNFQSMEELHQFLENNALKDIPERMRDPEAFKNPRASKGQNDDEDSADRVVISVDVGILTTLLSLEEAVRNSTRRDEISAKALYWAKMTSLLVNEITEGYQYDLQDYLTTAQSQIDPAQMEALIYASAA
ncbi:hypothetical protein F6476_26725 [Pseudomonas umsongensis]|uniref:hypothetical protein n=1 Tax=Pseudomonas umsongensis TaxID=198618 RepID=UPI001243A42E|nr:hypothetical protein [Pseudomonas umsongensis]QFG32500.1 hypothetical protein F6476_26725 [Pseudomonas umsongensis]